VIHSGAKGGDELQPRTRLAQDAGVDAIGHRRHQYVRLLHGFDQLCRSERLIGKIEARVE
jgi:hypothetical protein